jgi:purine-cytosine permease-like protein
MSENLYEDTVNQQVSGQTTNPAIATYSDSFGMDVWLSRINYIVLAWVIVYTILFVCDFFFYRIRYNEGEVTREKKGVRSLRVGIGMWWTYIACLGLFAFYSFNNSEFKILIGWITIVAYILKVIIADLPEIPFLGTLFGLPGKKVNDLGSGLVKEVGKFFTDMIQYIIQMFSGSSSGGGSSK